MGIGLIIETMEKSKITFTRKILKPSRFGKQTILIYDKHLGKVSPSFRSWMKGFTCTYGVEAGESLKDINGFPVHIAKIIEKVAHLNSRELTVVAAGGGSVGDFAGFVASILKRGVGLIHVPTTWLAAVDSSHGGKTAMNVASAKNQIGTFYPAKEIVICYDFLKNQPEARALEALGELAKIAIIDGGPWRKKMREGMAPAEMIWKTLKSAIESKYRVVNRDPYEKTGVRQILNLGHTFGHVLEAELGVAHGMAVAQGTFFALNWSFEKKYIKEHELFDFLILLEDVCGFASWNVDSQWNQKALTEKRVHNLLLKDKKREKGDPKKGDTVTFLFVHGWGKVKREKVRVAEVIAEARAQGWMK